MFYFSKITKRTHKFDVSNTPLNLSTLYKIKTLISFYSEANTIYKIHSPFVFSFMEKVFNTSRHYYAFDRIEYLREALKQSNELIEFKDFGAKAKKDRTRKVKDIAKSAVSPKNKCRWLFNTVNHFHPKTVIELGTSLGISTLYLASAESNTPVYTHEGDPQSAALAHSNFTRMKMSNIQLIEGRFEETFQKTLDQLPQVGLAYLDGNHSYEATIQYFNQCLAKVTEQTILIFDDIYWSPGMTKAWDEIKKHPRVRLTIDLYQIAYVFFDPAIEEKQHFKVIDPKYKPWQKYLP